MSRSGQPPDLKKYMDKQLQRDSCIRSNRSKTTIYGWLFVGTGSLVLLGFLFTAFISKLLPPSNNPLIAAVLNDRYYCYLVPITLPVLVAAVYFHWLSMKLFRHA